MGVEPKNRGGFDPPKSSILIGFSIYFHHPFWSTTIFGNAHVQLFSFAGICKGQIINLYQKGFIMFHSSSMCGGLNPSDDT